MNHKHLPLSVLASSVALVMLGILLTDPFDITMNNMVLIVISGLLFGSFAVFAGLFWNEQAADERESVLVDKASRLGYLAGMSVLITALITQSFTYEVDAWLVLTIAVMIVSKHTYLVFKR